MLTQHEHLVYDPFDRLIGRYIDSTGSGTFDHTELYVYDGSDVVLEFNGAGSLTNRYLNGPSPSGADQVYAEGDVTSLTSPDTVTYVLTDQQGSGRDIVDSNGNLVDHSIFPAFGQTAFESNPAVHPLEGFAGGLPDPVTGEIHFGERNLNAVDAVWSSEDPIGLNGGDTNFRRYVGNDPMDYTDPTGLAKKANPFRLNWHHLLDKAIFDAEFLARHGLTDDVINVNCAAYGWMLKAKDHTFTGGIHPEGWSRDWTNWIQRQEDNGVKITKEMIDAKLARMKVKYAEILEKGKPATMSYQDWTAKLEAARDAAKKRAAAKALKQRKGAVSFGSGSARKGAGAVPALKSAGRMAGRAAKLVGPAVVAYETVNTPYDENTTTIFGPHIDAFFESLISCVNTFGFPERRPWMDDHPYYSKSGADEQDGEEEPTAADEADAEFEKKMPLPVTDGSDSGPVPPPDGAP